MHTTKLSIRGKLGSRINGFVPGLEGRPHCRMGTATPSTSTSPGVLGVLQKTRPVDRLRYQAKLIFDTFDTDGDGQLSSADLQTYFAYSDSRLGGTGPVKDAQASVSGTGSEPGVDFEGFVDLVRAQVAAARATKEWTIAQVPTRDLSRLMFKAAITLPEMGGALAIFKLLDGDADGFLQLEDLRKAQGIELQMVDGLLEDADADDDGKLSFEDFLVSYKKERPVFMAMAVMLCHTALFYVILSLPVDTILKVLMAGFILLKPQIVTGAVVNMWNIGKAIWNRIRATQEMAGKGASWSSLA